MNSKEQKDKKLNPIKDVLNKFKYSFQGMAYCFTHETSFLFEAISMVILVILGIIFNISFVEWVFAVLSLLLIMEVEFLNTAIEATVDMVTDKFHPLAKIAKDCGSAATCMATFMALIVNLVIFVPKVLPLIIK